MIVQKPAVRFTHHVHAFVRDLETSFSEKDHAQTCVMRPAAIRRLGVTGKVPVLSEKDGRHPKYENHGRIAGR